MGEKNESTMDKISKMLVMTRFFDAPRELVFKAWTDPKQVALWWGPHGFSNPVCELDPRPGGVIQICMDSPKFPDHWMDGKFLEVNRPEKLVFTSKAFLTEAGNAGIEVMNTVLFEEENGKTKLTLIAEVTRIAPEFQFAEDGMDEGWSQSLERLEAFLYNKEIY
jgi:uncharacterized protein YndB with AHSA1/START domain